MDATNRGRAELVWVSTNALCSNLDQCKATLTTLKCTKAGGSGRKQNVKEYIKMRMK